MSSRAAGGSATSGSRAVTTMIGMRAVAGLARSFWQTVQPSMTGIRMSSSTTSGCRAQAR
jgi:hypothetical protein